MVVLLSWEAALDIRNRITVAPISSRIRGLDAEVLLDEDDGVRERCAINCDVIATVLKRTLRDPVTRLSTARMRDVERAIHLALGMPLPCRIA